MSIFARTTCAALFFGLFLCGCSSGKENAALEVIDKKYPVDPDASNNR
jgi:hypothetical protein